MTAAEPAHPPPPRLLMLLRMALWFGVLTGLTELGFAVYKKLVKAEFVWLSREVVWMAQLGNALYMVVVALPLLLVTGFRPGTRAAATVFTTLGLFCFLLSFGVLHPLASLAVATGVATQVGRLVGARAAGFERLVWRTTPVLAALVLLLGIGVPLASWWSSPTPPDASRRAAPNVILITLDTVRAESLSLHGFAQPTTPRLEELAKRGVTFDRALAPAPWTLPSHASMFTGRFPHRLSADWMVPLDATHATLAEAFLDEGYATAGFASNLNYCGAETGLDRGFSHYDDYPISFGQMVLNTALGRALTNNPTFRGWLGYHDNLNRKTAEQVTREFLDWQQGVDGRPFFAFLNYYDAHQPYLPPPEFAGRFGPTSPRGELRYDTNMIEVADWHALAPAAVQAERDAYHAAIAYIDDQLGKLVAELGARDALANTVIAITSDHGEQFGEHGLYDHGNSVYLPVVHVPLLILAPTGIPAGSRVAHAVSLRDLPRTLLELAGLAEPHGLDGNSLSRMWSADRSEDVADVVLSEVKTLGSGAKDGHMRSLVIGRYHFILNGDDSPELYDIEYDPAEKHDLSTLDEDILARFEKAMKLVFE